MLDLFSSTIFYLKKCNIIEASEIILGCINRNSKCQKKLYDTYASLLYAICLRYLKNTDDAKDALQDGFIKIYQKIDEYKNEGSFEGWIKRVIVNTCLQEIRNRKKIVFTEKDELKEDVNITDEIEENYFEGITPGQLFEIIKELPDGYRTIFNLFVLDGFNHKEISEQLSITEGTSKSQLARAKKHLRDKINVLINADKIRYGKVI